VQVEIGTASPAKHCSISLHMIMNTTRTPLQELELKCVIDVRYWLERLLEVLMPLLLLCCWIGTA
jgi:hypothetical protein